MQQKDWTKKFGGMKILWMIPGLTVLFFMDDFLMVILVEKLQIFKVSGYFYDILLAWLFIVSAVLAYAVFYTMRRKPTTGALGMIGEKGKILSKRGGYWQVDVRGEIWRCESGELLKAGDHVFVEGVEGIILKVLKAGKQQALK
ncbi:MAG: hypothetical protein GWP06_02605 [Actinobacteria bacterium]|nr:hypothetical protein [Actinomycetota bacterium]